MKPTGVVLARNEELNIVACLQSFAPHVDDLILIDMESKDRTVELARPLVTKILSHPLIPNFDVARNIAIPEARHEWIWFLDADERVSPATGRLVSDTLRDHGHEFHLNLFPRDAAADVNKRRCQRQADHNKL